MTVFRSGSEGPVYLSASGTDAFSTMTVSAWKEWLPACHSGATGSLQDVVHCHLILVMEEIHFRGISNGKPILLGVGCTDKAHGIAVPVIRICEESSIQNGGIAGIKEVHTFDIIGQDHRDGGMILLIVRNDLLFPDTPLLGFQKVPPVTLIFGIIGPAVFLRATSLVFVAIL